MYVPQLARFKSRDPLPPDGEPILLGKIPEGIATSAPGAVRPYAYSDNNPVNLVDPSGLVPIRCDCVTHVDRMILPFSVNVNCPGLADTCCKTACGGGLHSWTGEWQIIQPPQHPLSPTSPVKPLTPDIKRVIECCGGDPACEQALADLFLQIADTPSQGFYGQTEDKCFNWLRDFLKKHYPKYGPSSKGKISLAGGKIVLRPLEINTMDGRRLGFVLKLLFP